MIYAGHMYTTFQRLTRRAPPQEKSTRKEVSLSSRYSRTTSSIPDDTDIARTCVYVGISVYVYIYVYIYIYPSIYICLSIHIKYPCTYEREIPRCPWWTGGNEETTRDTSVTPVTSIYVAMSAECRDDFLAGSG